MKTLLAFVGGLICEAFILGGVWYILSTVSFKPHRIPQQVTFDSTLWKTSDSSVRGQMYKDLIRYLEVTRPTIKDIPDLLGPSGYSDKALLNGAEYFYIYHIDLGQRMGGKPFLDKLGIAFDKEGRYSHSTVWD